MPDFNKVFSASEFHVEIHLCGLRVLSGISG